MKRILTLLFVSTLISFSTKAQCTGISFTVSADSVPCGGGPVDIVAWDSSSYAFANDFNLGNAGPGWSASPAAQFNNPCGPGLGGSTDPHLWMGNTTAAPRELATANLDLSQSCGADSICFDFRMSIQGDPSPCEGPDLSTEGVYIEWSTNSGGTWNNLFYFQPNTAGSFNSQSPGSGDYTGWANYCFAIPPAAITTSTMFHWYQGGSSGNGFDHWGIDNVVITAVNCAYYYDWQHLAGSPDTNSINVNALGDTTYTVLYTNGIDDTCVGTVTIYEDTTIAVTESVTIPSCNTSNDGQIDLVPNSGSPTYTFNLFGVSTNDTIGSYQNLAPGWYTYDVLDANGCYTFDSVEVVNGPGITAIVLGTSPTTCPGVNTGTADIQGYGNPGYVYTINGPDTLSNTTGDFSGLGAGTYTVDLYDTLGCYGTTSFTINTGPGISVTATGSDETCNGVADGAITANGSAGSSPYTYVISGAGTGTNQTGTFTGLQPGTYYIEVTDSVGCVTQDSVVIDSGAVVAATVTSTNTVCSYTDDGQVNVSGSNGLAPYTYDINGNGISNSGTTGAFNNLPAGTYTVTVTDDNGCTYTESVTVGSPLPIDADFSAYPPTGIAPLDVNFTNESTNATSYEWDFGDGNSSILSDPSNTYMEGTYEVMLIASDGPCSDTAYMTIYVIYESVLIIPNIITPNGDGMNDGFGVVHEGLANFECAIFNRWGQELYRFTNPDDSWDAKTPGGNPVPDGTYFYVLKASGIDGVVYDRGGQFTVVQNK